jgi:hypothetical protein
MGHSSRRLALSAAMVAFVTLGVAAGTADAAVAAGPRAGVVRVNPPDPALAAAVATWVTNGGEADLDALGSDFTALEQAANASDLASMSAGCTQLQSDVEAAQQYDPIPDPQAQHDWSAALAEYARGATDCVAGADTSNVDLITKASQEITAGSTDLDRVTARLNVIAG